MLLIRFVTDLTIFPIDIQSCIIGILIRQLVKLNMHSNNIAIPQPAELIVVYMTAPLRIIIAWLDLIAVN